ncbi:MAG: bacteriocin fulvocin C-related protein [Bacteroidetes bacterium]|nr:bacteriocin fulvocin C-related protein [Bacteroidota bacterium]
MKKIVLSLFAIGMLSAIVVSCQKEKEKIENNSSVARKTSFNGSNQDSHSMRIELLSFGKDEQKQLFNTLKPEQKAGLWKDKINEVLNKNDFNNYQMELLKELLNNISKELYIPGSMQEKQFKEVFHKEWIAKAKGQFIFDDLVIIVGSLDTFENNKGPISGGGGDRVDDCECSTSSDWCSMNMTCKTSRCIDSAHGCGTLWTYSCKGMCGWN